MSQRWWWISVAAYAALVTVLSVIPVAPGVVSIKHLDRVAHLCEYLVFAWLLTQALRAAPAAEALLPLVWAWIYATSYGLLMEAVQAMIPWRSAELGDAAMNALGAALGVWIGRRMPPERWRSDGSIARSGGPQTS